MFCSECGSEIRDGKTFCTNCGARQPVEQTTTPAQPPGITPPPSLAPPPQQQIPLPSPVMKPKSPSGRRTLWMVLAGAGVVIIVAAIVIGSVLIWGGESNEEAAQKVVNGYYSALKAQDADAAWNLLAADTREQIGSKSKLKEIIKTTFGDIKFTFKVGKATVKDNKATVKVVGTVDGKADTATLSLVKEDGVWRLDFVGTGEESQGEDGSSAKSTAELRTCQANQRTVDGAVMSYQANDPQTRYPSSLNDMIQPGVQVLKSIPTCPSGKEYIWIPAKGSDPPYISCPVHPGP